MQDPAVPDLDLKQGGRREKEGATGEGRKS